jgi:hypothetical protein
MINFIVKAAFLLVLLHGLSLMMRKKLAHQRANAAK